MMESSRRIYDVVLGETDAVLKALEQPTKNLELDEAIQNARDSFRTLKLETDSTLKELGKNAEWDAFTIALYGETNAGKSTIIETLRILMGEKSKLDQQRKFREVIDEYGIDANAVQTLERKNKEIAGYDEELGKIGQRFQEESLLSQELKESNASRVAQIAAEIKALPFWRRGLLFFWKHSKKLELESSRKELDSAISEIQRRIKQHEHDKQVVFDKITEAKKSVDRIGTAMKELAVLEDGVIIGDGRSDFTRESTRYDFEVNGNKLALLDVPGIEGKEELVRESIMQAVRKAHAVLYVTRKADPPQKGNEKTGSKGTLEKIKEHLGAQTEVWAVFNKGIKSVEPLRAKQLINDGERGGLSVLEDEMQKQLGENYAGLFPLSAYAAFVVSTENFIPEGEKAKARKKFLSAFDADEILKKTGLHDLVVKLSSEMAENGRLKIRKSNFNKANQAVLQLKSNILALNKEKFSPLNKKLEKEALAAESQLESAMNVLKNQLESDAIELMDRTRSDARLKIYQRIDSDVGDDEFKTELERNLRSSGSTLEIALPTLVEEIIAQFQREVEGIIEQFQEHVQGFLEDAVSIKGMDFKTTVNIDNGLKVAGLIGGAIGVGVGIFALANAWNPAGWTAAAVYAAIGIVASIASIAKSVWGVFSKDYKKSQQKKSADENLKKFFDSVKMNYAERLQENFQKLEEKMEAIKEGFALPAMQAAQIKSSLGDIGKRLGEISERIVKEGGLR